MIYKITMGVIALALCVLALLGQDDPAGPVAGIPVPSSEPAQVKPAGNEAALGGLKF